jgi:dihydropteroate synthase
MGILNITPDSFAERVRYRSTDDAVSAAVAMVDRGADLIDIGGESTRPGADPVTASEEIERVVPVLERLRSQIPVPTSIDTSKSDVARAALDAGASIVNDVTGLMNDPEVAAVAAARGAALVLMHTRGTPKTMGDAAIYDDVVSDVIRELRGAIDRATSRGMPTERLIIDPGIGFAKRPSHSYGVLARLGEIAAALDRPVLVGPSRKSFMRAALNDAPAAERDWGTAAAVAAAVLAGAHVVRVHAVEEMAQVVRVAEMIRAAGLGAGG